MGVFTQGVALGCHVWGLRPARAQHEALDVQSINDGVAGGGHNFNLLIVTKPIRVKVSLRSKIILSFIITRVKSKPGYFI